MYKINFLCIGAQRAGTSWLAEQILKSEQIELPSIKEIHYFVRSDVYPSPNTITETKLIKRLFEPMWLIRSIYNCFSDINKFKLYSNWYFSNYNDDWYLSLFKDLNGCKGEITPAYAILKEENVAKMSALLGRESKIIFMLRNPIERA